MAVRRRSASASSTGAGSGKTRGAARHDLASVLAQSVAEPCLEFFAVGDLDQG
ncbi:MAG: hypothetical protein ACFB03_17610 [Paracoccaceae bacterium]